MSQDPGADRFTEVWHAERAYLVDLAYRMLGSVADAEDVVQEAFTRLSRTESGSIRDERGWLTIVTSRLCLDILRSARIRREFSGDPAPLLAAAPAPVDLAGRITLDDEVRSALLVILQRLGPAERVAFVLHDVFAVPFDVIAETLGKPVGTCRQLARRARHKITDDAALSNTAPAEQHRQLTEHFLAACSGRDLAGLLAILHPNAWGRAVFVTGSPRAPVLNRGPKQVADSLISFYGPHVTLVSQPAPRPRLLGYVDRRLFAVLTLTIADGLVLRIDAKVDLES